VAADHSHHVLEGQPLYAERFDEVLKFHAPGLAPVRRGTEAWHINVSGNPAYTRRFRRTFGFYEDRAAVMSEAGWHHLRPNGEDLYPERYAWCGNYQGGRCTVRDGDGLYRHLDLEGQPAYPERWRYAGDYRDGIAVVQGSDGRSTHIDAAGHLLHGRWFLDLDVFHKGFARARDEAGWMHIDGLGQPLSPHRFAMVEPFYNGQARVERLDGALELIDEQGATVLLLRTPTQLVPASPLRLGDFTLEETTVLARTAWGTVRMARAADGQRVVAKTTRGSHAREHEVLRLLAGHPHVPGVRGRVDVDGGSWLFLEHRPGRILGGRNRCEPLPVGRAIAVILAVLEVCAHLHDEGFAHTDLHPENVLVADTGGAPGVTVLDYAHAIRLGTDGVWRGEVNWGRWEFVPPEQLRDFTTLDATVDVYASAALLAYLIRGTTPFRVDVRAARTAGGWEAVRDAFLAVRASPDLRGLDVRLASLLQGALSLDPKQRPDVRTLSRQLNEELHAHV
jgi:hypothetical protein